MTLIYRHGSGLEYRHIGCFIQRHFPYTLPTIALICNCNNYLIHRERIRQDVNKFLGIYRVRILFESIICHFPKLFLRACRRSSDLVMVISRQEVTAGIVTQSKKCRPNIYACMYVHTHTHIYIYKYIECGILELPVGFLWRNEYACSVSITHIDVRRSPDDEVILWNTKFPPCTLHSINNNP